MRQFLPTLEGDGNAHRPVTHQASPSAPISARGESGTQPNPSGLTRETRELRSAALRAWFPKAVAWASNRIRHARMCEAERYLSQATDLADLERRMQEADRRGISFNQD
jgi:hypothetical protein